MSHQLLRCPHCGAKMAFERRACGRCGRTIVRKKPPDTSATDRAERRRRLQLGAAGLGVLLAAVAIVGVIGRARTVEAVPSAVLLAARTTAVTVHDADAELVSVSTRQPGQVAEPSKTAASSAGFAAFQSGDYSTALARFGEALSHDPNDADVLNNAGQVLVELNRAGEAVAYLERAVAARPSDPSFKFNLAVALARSGDHQRAGEAYQDVVEATPNDSRAHHNLGLALRQLGRDEEAIPAFERATVLAPREAPPWLGLALSLDRIGRAAEAADAYEQYLGLDPDSPDATRMRERIKQLRDAAQD